MGGRVAMTVPSIAKDATTVSIGSDKAGVGLVSATAWGVKSIWVSAEEVLATERRDGGEARLMADRIHAQQQSA